MTAVQVSSAWEPWDVLCGPSNYRRPSASSRREGDVGGRSCGRRGVATLDYILAIGIVLPMLAILWPQGRRAMQLVYEMTTTLVAWPFM